MTKVFVTKMQPLSKKVCVCVYVCVKNDDIIFNYTLEKDWLIDGSVPWPYAWEKYQIVYLMFIKSLTNHDGVVVDVIVSTYSLFLW